MAEPFFGKSEADNRSAPPSEIPEAPPGLAEITIRTMASDIESMSESGGGLPQAGKLEVPLGPQRERVKEEELSPLPQKEEAALTPGQEASPEEEQPSAMPQIEAEAKPHTARRVIIGVFAAAALFFVGYYLIPIIFPSSTQVQEITPKISTPTSSTITPQPTSEETFQTHQSFFHTPADETFTLLLQTTSATSTLQSYNQELASLLKQSRATSTFFEIVIQGAENKSTAWSDFLPLMNITVLKPEFWDANFVSDFTAYIYKDKNGLWPGYIVRLKDSRAPLLLQTDIAKLESDPAILRNFFIDLSTTVFKVERKSPALISLVKSTKSATTAEAADNCPAPGP